MKKSFEELKKEITDKAKEHDACASEYRKALDAKSEAELLTVIKSNLEWLHVRKIISPEYFEGFDRDTFIASGVANTGEENTGWGNAGYANAGYANAGNYNAGNYNAGYANAGNDNAGNYNAGNYNAGYANAGNYNAGNYNAGNRNAGYANAGNDNAGAFNSVSAPYVMFNKPTNWTFDDFRNSRAFNLLHNVNQTFWIQSSAMSDEEKKKYPYHETTGGYIKYIPFKEAFHNMWHNLSESDKNEFKSLPNFDQEVFESITGVKV